MLTVKERGHFVATLRYVHVTLMETLAAWVPTTPEVEVKLLLGEHIWDVAQHADSLGKRTFELRLPLQHSARAADPYVAIPSAKPRQRQDGSARCSRGRPDTYICARPSSFCLAGSSGAWMPRPRNRRGCSSRRRCSSGFRKIP